MNRPRLMIVWRITENCNLTCPFCEYNCHIKRNRRNADLEKVVAFGKILKDYTEEYDHEICVSWIGGEPFLWRHIREATRVFKEEFCLQISATTNGTKLNSPGNQDFILRSFDELTVSIDGNGDVHDNYRGTKGLFDLIIAGLRNLTRRRDEIESSLLIRINTILTRQNVYNFRSLCKELAEIGVDELSFNHLGGEDNDPFFEQNKLRPQDILHFSEELPQTRKQMIEKGLAVLGTDKYVERLSLAVSGTKVPIQDCRPGQKLLFIDEAGNIGPCSSTTTLFGRNIEDVSSAKQFHDLPFFFSKRKQIEMLPPCFDCPSTNVFGKFVRPESS